MAKIITPPGATGRHSRRSPRPRGTYPAGGRTGGGRARRADARKGQHHRRAGVCDARCVLHGGAPHDLQGDRGAVDGAQTDRPLYRDRAAERQEGAQEGGRGVVPGAAHAEGRLGGQRRVPCQDHRPEIRAARADTLGDRDTETLVRRIDRCDGADRVCRRRGYSRSPRGM